MRDDSMLAHIKNLPNWFTSASIFCGFYSLCLAAQVQPGETEALFRAAVAIVFAGLFDALDGRVARMTNSATEFGIQYDSLADVISFGLAPAFLLYQWGLAELGPLGLLCAAVFVVAGAMRLARFNIITKKMSNKWSLGLTITESGGLVAALVICHHRLVGGSLETPVLLVGLTLGLAFLMVSNLRFRTFKRVRLNQRSLTGILLGFLSCAALLFIYRDFSVLLVFLPTAHILSGLIEEALFHKQRRLEEEQALVMQNVSGAGSALDAFHDEPSDEPR